MPSVGLEVHTSLKRRSQDRCGLDTFTVGIACQALPRPRILLHQPLEAVEKQLNGAFNRHDLSCPHGKSVDDGTKEYYGSLMYQTVDKSQYHSPHSKRDLKNAFHKIPASPLDHWYLVSILYIICYPKTNITGQRMKYSPLAAGTVPHTFEKLLSFSLILR